MKKHSLNLLTRHPSRTPAWRVWLRAMSLTVLLANSLAACSIGGGASNHTVTIATIFPMSGASAALGRSLTRAVDLAVSQHTALGGGYTLKATHIDEASVTAGSDAVQAGADANVIGVVGPFDSDTAVATLPALAGAGIVTISPTAMLPGLTQADQAAKEGLTFSQLHPQGKPVSFFRMTADDNAAGAAAASHALEPTSAHGLGSRSVFLVDDGSLSGKAQTAAFQSTFQAGHGSIVGRRSITEGDPIGLQIAVSAIIKAQPNCVFFAGDEAQGADLRRALTLTGAPKLVILTTGTIAGDPSWSSSVGSAAASAYTIALLPAQSLSKIPGGESFEAAYQKAYPGSLLTPQSALAYDAAMDEINAIASLVTTQRPVTRAAVLSAVANAKYSGVTGEIAFNKNGDPAMTPGFSVFSCNTQGVWNYQTSIAGKAAGA